MKLLRLERREVRVSFCDGCSTVCDARCRSNAPRAHSYERAYARRVGLR